MKKLLTIVNPYSGKKKGEKREKGEEEKVKFFDYVDANWTAEKESD